MSTPVEALGPCPCCGGQEKGDWMALCDPCAGAWMAGDWGHDCARPLHLRPVPKDAS